MRREMSRDSKKVTVGKHINTDVLSVTHMHVCVAGARVTVINSLHMNPPYSAVQRPRSTRVPRTVPCSDLKSSMRILIVLLHFWILLGQADGIVLTLSHAPRQAPSLGVPSPEIESVSS